ncbi:putative cysteine desulfurase [Roseobacter fucihabitans]|uniref:Cysteine desulfurase n=1 Tax=Roseobacter fucihabitans TaxID=1537242 RepID=A0ABZ2BUN5_9RHOB|nr:aminotransferase class V-fold PLP-dependent enzyme [Roseobacter litoralis]MBC6964743.1 putative cysteine desulfurase [Roseobacter litoralis]
MTPSLRAISPEIRSRFAHVDACPFEGPRVYFENAGGALTLNSVIETSGVFAAYPDNAAGRDNPAGAALRASIERGKADARVFLNAPDGQIFIGESGTEVLFRLVRTAALGAKSGGKMLGSTLEHPASRSAVARWAEVTQRPHILVPHDDATGTVGLDAYLPHITPDLRIATIVQTSPVTGISVDVGEITAAIRQVAPACFIIIDGIQHASHGQIDIAQYGADGYAVSPYKVFSRHGYGLGWASERLSACPKETVIGGSETSWEQGTRDAGSYATFSDVVAYFAWLGRHFTDSTDTRAQILAAGKAIQDHEHTLISALMHGTGNHRGLADIPGVMIIAGADNPRREGVISLTLEGMEAGALVGFLNTQGIRTHIRNNDHYCGNILSPLGLESCVRVSINHYNTEDEVSQFLQAMNAAALL